MLLVFIVTFCVIIALGFGGAAAWSDYNRLLIPNIYAAFIGAAFVPAFLAMMFFAPDVAFFASWKAHLLSFVFMFLLTYLLFYFKMIGGGDAKFISVFSLWVGIAGLMPFLFSMVLVGALVALVTLSLEKWKPVQNPVKGSWIEKAQKGERHVPYGIAIFIGAVFAFWKAGYIQPAELMALAIETTGS